MSSYVVFATDNIIVIVVSLLVIFVIIVAVSLPVIIIITVSLLVIVIIIVTFGLLFIVNLCFEQAQPKKFHCPKVDDGVDVFLKYLENLFSVVFFEEFKTDIKLKPLELFD